jgi:hypothetical protein
VGKLRYRQGAKIEEDFHADFGREGELFCIGDADICGDIEGQRNLRDIRRHSANLSKGTGADAHFEHDLEKARMSNAERKSIEQMVLEKIKAKHVKTVGGSIQKLVVFATDGGRAISAYTEDRNFELSEGLPFLNDEGLQYMSVNQAMGRLTEG